MVKQNDEVVEEAVEETTEEEPTEEEEAEETADVAVVHYRGTTREYSKEIHGRSFRKLAKQFAEKVDGEVK